ncbi:5'-nucleotidase C-terminal domain-containing protein, partial [Cupriavidus sp. 8B]
MPGTRCDATRSVLGDVCNKDADVIARGGGVPQLVAQAFLERGKASAGSRLSQLEVKSASGYVPLDPARTYAVITNNFLADGQDGYTTMKSVAGARRSDVGLDYAEAFLTYVEGLPGASRELKKLPVADYSTQLFT